MSQANRQSLTAPQLNLGGIILCGGKSTRMGSPKALLPFGSETMLGRVVQVLRGVVEPIVVVAAPQQELPALDPDVLVARDLREARGPLEGLLAGLTAMVPHRPAAFVTSCDVPLLAPAFVQRLGSLLQSHEIVVPRDESFHHPLAAVYRVSLLERIQTLLAHDQLRPAFLFDRSDTLRVPVEQLRDVDPQLDSLRNLNSPEDYLAALAQAGFELDPSVRLRD